MPTPSFENHRVMLGCDPEFFFTKNGNIIGSEKVIPIIGLGCNLLDFDNQSAFAKKVVRDGVQAELQPLQSKCRVVLISNLTDCFCLIREVIKKDKTLGISFKQTIKIPAKEFRELGE